MKLWSRVKSLMRNLFRKQQVESQLDDEVRASALGLILGLCACAGALRAMRSVLYGVGVYDTSTIVAVVLVPAAVTAIATAAPTLRIAGIDPAKTLREE